MNQLLQLNDTRRGNDRGSFRRLLGIGLGGLLALALGGGATAQDDPPTMDFGRGELPVHLPSSYDGSESLPLIIVLHGYTSSGERHIGYFGLGDLVDRYRFILVAPDGVREPAGEEHRFWNATAACCNFYGVEVDDSAYLRNIIDEIQARYNVDDKRVYLIGHSNGGFMSYRMAWEHSDAIAAIASLAGANHLEERDPPPQPVHVLQIHGTADTVILFGGGDIRDNSYPSALQSAQVWAGYNGCGEGRYGREARDLDASLPGHESGVLVFNDHCSAGGSAELWTIAAGAHSPILSDSFAEQVVEWLYEHPKP